MRGMGKSGDKCNHNAVRQWATKFEGDGAKVAIKYIPITCNRNACPDCYTSGLIEQTFRYVTELEAYARHYQERPASLFASPPQEVADTWNTMKMLNNRLHQRSYREAKKMGAFAGLRAFHPWRIRPDIKKRLRALGYKEDGRRGFFKGVRDDVLNLGDWSEYVYWSPHDHLIVFPSYLKEHTSTDFVVGKIRMLANLKQLLATVRYLLTHDGKIDRKGDASKPTTFFGRFSGNKPWKAADHLAPDDLVALKHEVAKLMGMIYEPDTDSIHFPKEEEEEEWDWMGVHTIISYMRDWEFRSGLSIDTETFLLTLCEAMLDESLEHGRSTRPRLDKRLLFDEVEKVRPKEVTAVLPAGPPKHDPGPLTDEDFEEEDEEEVGEPPPPVAGAAPEPVVSFLEEMVVRRRSGEIIVEHCEVESD